STGDTSRAASPGRPRTRSDPRSSGGRDARSPPSSADGPFPEYAAGRRRDRGSWAQSIHRVSAGQRIRRHERHASRGQGERRAIEPDLLHFPPGPRGLFLGPGREVVAREPRPDEARRVAGKWVRGQQARHRLRALQETLAQVEKPRRLPEAVQRREPHLPIEARHMRPEEGRRALWIARLVAELVRLPRGAVVGALDPDLGAGRLLNG